MKIYDDMDRSFLLTLRAKWNAEGTMTPDEVEHIATAMSEIDHRCEQLVRIARDEIVPATVQGDCRKLITALVSYKITVWELREFDYLQDLEELLEQVLEKLDQKCDVDDDDAENQNV